MRKLLLLLLTFSALAACDKTHDNDYEGDEIDLQKEMEGKEPVYGLDRPVYRLDLRVTDADGGDRCAEWTAAQLGALNGAEYSYAEAAFGGPMRYEWSIDRGAAGGSVLTLHMCREARKRILTRTPELSIRSEMLFGDDAAHVLRATIADTRTMFIYRAVSLTFDGRTIEPDADGVFVIRPAQ